MKILHVINQVCGRAGAEVSLRDIVTRGDGMFHAVAVLRSDVNVLGPFEERGVPCFVPRASLGRAASVRHVRAAIRSFRPDLVHTSLFDADLAGRTAAWIERVPAIASFVNTPYLPEAVAAEPVAAYKLRAIQLLDGLLARHLTNGFHAISEATAEHAVEYLGISRHDVRVVPRGRSRDSLGEPSAQRRALVRERMGWGARPIIINVAREEPQKGQRFLVSALPGVLEEHPDALLIMVGRQGRSSLALDASIQEFGVTESVQRLGVRLDVPDLLSAADVFAFPSLYEGLGGAAIEALGLGVPIVASDIPALRELVGEDRGWLVPPGDTALLAARLREVLGGEHEVRRRSRAARHAFDSIYELQWCLVGMQQLYTDIANQLPANDRSSRRRLRFMLAAPGGTTP